jgi:hypothetical protein
MTSSRIAATAVMLGCFVPPTASHAKQFQCDAIGDGAYQIIISDFDASVGWAIYRLQGDMAFMAGEEINGVTLALIEQGDDFFYDAQEARVQFWPVESFGRLFADGEAVDCYPAPPGGL